MITIPIKDRKGNIVGVIQALNKRNGVFADNDMYLLTVLANILAIRIENARMAEAETASFIKTIRMITKFLEARDAYTEKHSENVEKYMVAICKIRGLSEEVIREFKLGAQLHDIGKIGIPDAVLLKESGLTGDEYMIIKTHPKIGHDLLSHLDKLMTSLDVTLYHHERWDGKGYPSGLKGDGIPLSARIGAIADTFDAMTSDRPYRKGLRPSIAFSEVIKNAGAQFDPYLCRDIFAEYMKLHEDNKNGPYRVLMKLSKSLPESTDIDFEKKMKTFVNKFILYTKSTDEKLLEDTVVARLFGITP